MVLFHGRWIQRQFKEEENVEDIKRKLLERVESSSMHWLTDLVNELCYPPGLSTGIILLPCLTL